jgi:Lamin Tail Domain/CotH kinase protein/Dictyostelium (slime mold) repeat
MIRVGKSVLVVGVFACAALTASTFAQVVINEIHYNPVSGTNAEEFLEFYNLGASSVDMSGWSIADAVTLNLPPGTTIPGHGYLVAANSSAGLQAATGYVGAIQWTSGNLSNSGEAITLRNAAAVTVDTVTYSDHGAWPTAPDGNGPSLELRNPSLDNSQAGSWGASTGNYGTPGAQNSIFTNAPTIQSESPARHTAAASLPSVSVTFSTSVTGVTAGNLTVGGSAATALACASCSGGAGAGPYVFSGYATPAPGSVTIALASGSIAAAAVPFGGDSWTVSSGIVAVINELHYHPQDPDADAEFLELYNGSGATINMSGWTFTAGITETVPNGTTAAAGAYFVFAKNPALLQTKTGYAGATAWESGSLSNGGETITLTDAAGNVIDSVTYSDSGSWPTAPDGDGPSLELINPGLPNQFGGAWKPSLASWGTPGAVNSTFVAAPPPIIDSPRHAPILPLPNQSVTITAVVLDDGAAPPTATLYYRQDFDPTIAYTSTPMLDDGAHGDGAAGDGTFGAIVPGLPDGERLDFTIRASDGTNVSAAPAGNDTLTAGQNPTQTFLCKFSNPPASTDLPHYHLVTTQHTRNRQQTEDETQYDGSFVHCNAASGGCELFYNVVERYRGQTSLHQYPHGYRVDYSSSNPLQSEMGFPVKKLNAMTQQTDRQALGYQFNREAFNRAIPTLDTQLIRWETSPLSYGGTQDYPYNNVEVEDQDFSGSEGGAITPTRFPSVCTISLATCATTADCGATGGTCFDRTTGNLYKGVLTATLQYLGTDKNSYRVRYEKQTNAAADDFTDVMDLTRALDPATTSDANFESAFNAVADANEWARYFGIQLLLVNQEGGIYLDTGDDFLLYFDPPGSPLGHNTKILVRDQDSVFGGFGTFNQDTIWRTTVQTPQRFMRSNAFAGRFVGAICDLLDTDFTPAVMNPRIDALPPSVADASKKAQFKAWVVARIAYVNNEIVRQTTLTGVPASPYQNASPVISVSGQLNQRGTHGVLLNGAPLTNFSVYGHTWSASTTLVPGPNQITVQSVDVNGVVLDQATASVVYDPPVAPQESVRLTMPARMVNDKTLTLRAQVLDSLGNIDWHGCFSTLGTVTMTRVSDSASIPVTVTIFDNHLPVPAGSIRFYHGVGSVSFTLDGGASVPAGDYRVTVTVGSLTASKIVTVLSGPTWRNIQGTLSGADLVWGPNENIQIVGHDTEVPAGTTLTINPGTLIMVDTLGGLENGTLITVNGQVSAVGTQDNPIHFFSNMGPAAMIHTISGSLSNENAWRGLYHYGSGSSTYKWVILTGAGNGPITGHPRPPVFSFNNTHNLLAEDDVFVDSTGMMFQTPGVGTYTVRRSLISRVGIGCEFNGSGETLLIEDTWWTGIGRGPTTPLRYDGDLLHVDGAASNQLIRRCVIVDGGDDGIDQSASTFTVEDSILHDIADKAMSMTGGFVTMRNVLIYNSGSGVRGAGSAYNTTIASGLIDTPSTVQETIMWPSSVGACSSSINYTDGGDTAHVACGTGNISVNPSFHDTSQCDYNPTAGSPVLTAGPTGGRIGWLGFPTATACSVDSQCNDGIGCTIDTCVLGVCNFRPIAGCGACATNADCSDGNACTADVCGPLGSCQASQPVNCDDGNACTTDSCDPLLGCQHAAVNCDDANVCTTDSCSGGTCQHVNNTVSCNDGNLCTTGDVCSGGTCGGTAVGCPSGQTCNPGTGVCGIATDPPLPIVVGDTWRYFKGSVEPAPPPSPPAWAAIAYDDSTWLSGPSGFGYGPDGCMAQVATVLADMPSSPTPPGYYSLYARRKFSIANPAAVASLTAVVDFDDSVILYVNGVEVGRSASMGGTSGTPTAFNTPAASGHECSVCDSPPCNPAQSFSISPSLLVAGTNVFAIHAHNQALTSSDFILIPTLSATTAGCTTNADCTDNNVCNGTETCVTGTCQAGTALNCDDGNVCTTDSCVPATGCAHANNTVSCSDGDACTSGDTCAGGVCVGGAATNCDDGNVCTTDSCVPATGCAHANNTASCSDGNLCTTGDVCSGGACTGTPVSCTGGQTCNPATGACQSGPATVTFQQGASGYSGSLDTYIDAALGSQAAVTPIVIDGDPLEQALLRFDGIFGSGAGQIPSGSTVSSATLTVWTGTGANDQSANPVNFHRLLHTWSDADVWAAYGVAPWNATGGLQNDGVDALAAVAATTTIATAATSAAIDVTTSLQAWAAAPATNFGWAILPTGTDGLRLESNESTTAARRPLLSVTFTAPANGCTTNADCGDNNLCNGVETCISNACQPGTALNCDDGNVCTTDSCSATLGCQHANNTLSCSDGNACTTNDTCAGGTCVGGAAQNCDDGNLCTTDSCNTVTGCVHANNTLPCDDALFCNGHEVCSGGACQAGTPVNCDDGIGCTGDSCNEATDTCEHTACAVSVAGAGSRWLAVTPPPGLASVALRVTAPGLSCLPEYVDAAGALTSSPVFQSSAAWGTIQVGDRPIVPSTAYTVQAEVTPGTPIASASASTWAWGNANNTDDVNVFDIVCVLDGFQGIFTNCTPYGSDQNGGALAHPVTIDLDDILGVLDAFSGSSYPDATPCALGFAADASAKTENRSTPSKDSRVWLAPSAKEVAPGGTVRFDVFAQGIEDVRGYQIAVAAEGGAAGALVPGAVTIATYRTDYLFAGRPVSAVSDVSGVRLAGAIRDGGVTPAGVVYLGSFEYRASNDAAGTFRIGFRPQETMLRDSTSGDEPVDAGAAIDLPIGAPPRVRTGTARRQERDSR